MATIETRAAFARRRGVSKAAVTQWAQAGRIAVTDDGRVDVEASVRMLGETGAPSRGGKRKAGAAGGVQDGANEPAAPASGTTTLIAARTRVADIAAARAETEHRVRLGELVERERYAKAIADAIAPILSALDALPALVGADLAAETDVRKVQNILDDGIAKIRADMASTLQRLIDGPDTGTQ